MLDQIFCEILEYRLCDAFEDFTDDLAGNIVYPFYDNTMRWNKWTWSLNDISKLKHVAFRENVSS